MRLRITGLNRVAFIAAAIGTVFFLFACSSSPLPPEEPPILIDPAILEKRPRSILIMPPINRSLDVKGPITFLSTSIIPLAEAGYYVIPVTLSDQTFKQNGITVAEDAHAIPFTRLREIFGADAALYITITRFGTRYVLLDSITEASAFAFLVDLKNGEKLWSGDVSLMESSAASNNSTIEVNSIQDFVTSILGMAVNAALDQIVNVSSNKAHDLGRGAAYQMLSTGKEKSILYGPYHPMFGTD